MAEIGRSICSIDSYVISQKMHSDKIRIFKYYIYNHLHEALFANATLHSVRRHEYFRAKLLRGWLYYGFG